MEPELEKVQEKVHGVSHQFNDDQNADESSEQTLTIEHKITVRDRKRPKSGDDFLL